MLAAVAVVAAISSLIGYCEEVQAGSPLQRTFDDPTPTSYDFFGGSVAVDGSYVLIGASGDNTNGGGVGQAHLFDATTGALLQTFDDPTPTSYDLFGWSVALDSQNVLIGVSGDDTNGGGVGQAHLFNAATGALLRTFDDPTPTSYDFFGGSVAVDGNNVLIGASSDDTNGKNVGQVHLFRVVKAMPWLQLLLED
jgi:drug/metabolite transporter superfamily protein YnfA